MQNATRLCLRIVQCGCLFLTQIYCHHNVYVWALAQNVFGDAAKIDRCYENPDSALDLLLIVRSTDYKVYGRATHNILYFNFWSC